MELLRDELRRLRESNARVQHVPERSSVMTEQQVRNEADELGVLAIGGPRRADLRGSYVGSAAGSTFARIFFKQLGLAPFPVHEDADPAFEDIVTCQYAALPPEQVASHLLRTFIARTHTFWPFLRLPRVREIFKAIYRDARQSSAQDKFTVFMILALASAQCTEDKTYIRMTDLNSPKAYFQTGIRLFSALFESPRDLTGLQNLLLVGLWMLDAGWDNHVDDLWHLSRYLMSIALELGIHRRNPVWTRSQEDIEMRNRAWWCTYNLERLVAVITGRVLSVREHAIDAPLPSPNPDDALTPPEAASASAYQREGVRIFQLVTKLRRIGGRILESVYIARGADGRAPLTTFKQICDEFESLRLGLEEWKRAFDALDIKDSREHSELKLEYCQLLLIMHRPSPTFMIPSLDMVGVCSKAVSSSVRHWQKLQTAHGVSAVCRCTRQLHSILMVGLAGLYCDWQSSNVFDTTTNFLHHHGTDVDFCIDLVERALPYVQQGNNNLLRYRSLLQAARSKVYGTSLGSMLNPEAGRAEPQLGPDTAMSNLSDQHLAADAGAAHFDAGQGMESYFSQISGYFDSNLVGLDDHLTIWHDAFLEEIQSNRLAEG